jgi:hypothetical protein
VARSAMGALMTRSPQWDAWVEKARAVDIADFVAARGGLGLKKRKKELIGPCPQCGGDDRFSVSTKAGKKVFYCRGCKRTGDVIELVRFLDGCDFERAVEKLTGEAKPEPKPKPKLNGRASGDRLGKLVATYNYTDESDETLFQVCRYDPKGFRQRRPNGKGGWVWNMDGVRTMPFRLAELIEAISNEQIVVVVEGEKDVVNLIRIGIIATCNAGGAGKWLVEYAEHFRGADVVLIPDNDEAGFAHIQQVGASLSGVAKRVRVLVLPGLPEKGDVSDWLATGGTREQFDALVEQAPAFVPVVEEVPAAPSQQDKAKAKAAAAEQEIIDRLAALNQADYERERRRVAREQGWRASALDNMVNARRDERAEARGPAPLFGHWVVEPWPEEIDTGALVRAIVDRLREHVVMNDEAATVVALWILMAWVHDTAAVHSPILLITSAEMNSGKSTLVSLVGFLGPRAISTVGISEAALFRSVERWQPLVAIDEAEDVFKENEALRAIVNSGWTRGTGVLRCVGDDNEPHFFPTFCPKAVGMVGKRLPATTFSRSINIELKRKRAEDKAKHFRIIDDAGLAELRQQAMRWSLDSGEALKGAEPYMPAGFDNRRGDNYRLIFAVADLAGGDWPDKARKAAQSLSGTADVTSIGTRLLADIRRAFDEAKVDALTSAELIGKLTADADGQWAEWKSGKPLTQAQLARLLSPYGIGPERFYTDKAERQRGYSRAQFADAWERYVVLPGQFEL